MNIDALKDKASNLPLLPGVYLMKDKNDTVIYVGKAKKLKNRVSQYFQDTASHSPKTRLMVSKVDHFDVIIASSEFEALILECSLIKQYMPRYNILLKDDKGYPYLRLDMREKYPTITLVSHIEKDGAQYFGPFGSRGVTKSVMETIRLALKLPGCSRKFPRDLGKGRPCLNYHMNQCCGWCKGELTESEYRATMENARELLSGNYKKVAQSIRAQMLEASENLNFELAAALRDQLNAVENLGNKQVVTAGSAVDTDVFGYAQTEKYACYTVLHFLQGNLVDKEYEFVTPADSPESTLESVIKQYYLESSFVPKMVLLPFDFSDRELVEQMLTDKHSRKITLRVPQRGEGARLSEMASQNAAEEIGRITTKEENRQTVLRKLGSMLMIDPPERIESFDISNISGTDITASMVVFQDGKPLKSAYKKFKIEGLDGQDDYESMRQAVTRRFSRYLSGDEGFAVAPDLLLIDGGIAHAGVAAAVLREMKIDVPVYGMVKDDRHRTRALVTPDGQQINIDTQQSVFSLIGNIQEETHRFAITYHRSLRSKRLRYSELDKISGVGEKRKQDLIRHFGSLKAIKDADVQTLSRYLPANVAFSVYRHFHKDEE